MDLPFEAQNVPEGYGVEVDRFEVTFVGSDGQSWEPRTTYRRGPGSLLHTFPLARSRFEEWREDPVEVRGTFYLTVYGDQEEHNFTLSEDPVDVAHGLQCFSRAFGSRPDRGVSCRLPFRTPPFQVWLRQDGNERGSPRSLASYSPFPAGVDLNQANLFPIVRYGEMQIVDAGTNFDGEFVSYGLTDGAHLTLILREPVAHLRREFETTIDLADFVTQ